ncbi:restriction endonuclease subunit S [Micromonospora sp. LOL_024]|uniref:restriction endonuclease subunit S n=1 Tax=Micromonospora sp. LOL_024 TaxID=3345412 RepID=UPI003A873343
MPDWGERKLGDLITVKHGYAFKGEYFGEDPAQPVLVTPGNFAVGGGFKESKVRTYFGPEVEGFTLSAGDLIVTMTDLSKTGDTLGYPALVPTGRTYLHNQRIGLVEFLSRDSIPRFLYYVLMTKEYRHHILATATGSTVRHTSPGRIGEHVFRLPPLREQRAIASTLGALDDKIAINHCIVAASRELGIALYQAALGESGREIAVDEMSALLTRGQAPRYTNEPTGITVLNQKCVRDGRTVLEPSRLTEADRIKPDRLLQKYDVLVNSTGVGTLGRVGIWSHDLAATVDSHVTIIRIAPPLPAIIGGFALLAAQPEVEALGEGSTGQTELSRSKLASLLVSVPVRNVEELARRLSGLEDRADAALSESKTLTEIRNTLLPELMSGRLQIKDAERVVEEAV